MFKKVEKKGGCVLQEQNDRLHQILNLLNQER